MIIENSKLIIKIMSCRVIFQIEKEENSIETSNVNFISVTI